MWFFACHKVFEHKFNKLYPKCSFLLRLLLDILALFFFFCIFRLQCSCCWLFLCYWNSAKASSCREFSPLYHCHDYIGFCYLVHCIKCFTWNPISFYSTCLWVEICCRFFLTFAVLNLSHSFLEVTFVYNLRSILFYIFLSLSW